MGNWYIQPLICLQINLIWSYNLTQRQWKEIYNKEKLAFISEVEQCSMNTLWLLYFIILIIICVSQLVDPEGYDWLKEGESCPNADKEGDPLIINPWKYNSATMYSSSTWTESNCPIKYSHLPKVPRLAKSGQTNYKLDDFLYHFVQLHCCSLGLRPTVGV